MLWEKLSEICATTYRLMVVRDLITTENREIRLPWEPRVFRRPA